MTPPSKKHVGTPSLFGEEALEPLPRPARKPKPKPRARREPPAPAGPRVHVAIHRPVRQEFTYAVPAELAARAVPGARVVVPFGSLREVGVVVGHALEDADGGRRMRSILKVLDEEPLIDEEILSLTRWMAAEYACSWGEAVHAVLPAGFKREKSRATVLLARVAEGVGADALAQLEEKWPKQHRLLRTLLDVGEGIELRDVLKQLNLSRAPAQTLEKNGLITLERVPAARDPFAGTGSARDNARVRPAALMPDQLRAVEALNAAVDARSARCFLLEGVTGSGKTEVYLAAIEHALAQGRGAIVLVPEIALTPQTVGWFRSRFGTVAVLHSGMTDAHRRETWLGVKHGDARVVVGARSALFAPVADLGVIVVDEEHEPSFKQDSTPRYHTRDVAARRAQLAGAVCVLGSATPSLETWERARRGSYGHLHLPLRASGRALPPVEVLDLRLERRARGGTGLFTERLAHLMKETLGRKEQAILFQNRRGFAPVLWCAACKETLRCKDCDMSLTWHRRIDKLVCHSCCEEHGMPSACPACTAPRLRPLGAGSERIEQELGRLFPNARVRRMDSDTMRRREDYERVLGEFGAGDVDVLVGTQMIAKGLDFPRVTLVGIVDADGALHLPEFRAAERTFQLIAQVSGRAGRGEAPGRIVVQTHMPDHPAVQHAARHDFRGFAKTESELRAELGYPPHGRLLRVLFDDTDAERVEAAAARVTAQLEDALVGTSVEVLGPAPAPFAQLRGRHRRHTLLKCPLEGPEFVRARELLVAAILDTGRVRATIDVDPQSLL